MLLTVVALVAALGLLAYLWWLRRVTLRASSTEPEDVPDTERRAEHALFLRLLENLDTLDERYRVFAYRVLKMVALVGIACAVALAFNGKLLTDTHELAEQQRSGRAVAIDALCGAVSGVVEAGRGTITAGVGMEENKFTRALVKLGYPPIKVRRAQAEAAAREYARTISAAVERATGNENKKLTRKDGSLDCTRLKSVAGADQPVR